MDLSSRGAWACILAILEGTWPISFLFTLACYCCDGMCTAAAAPRFSNQRNRDGNCRILQSWKMHAKVRFEWRSEGKSRLDNSQNLGIPSCCVLLVSASCCHWRKPCPRAERWDLRSNWTLEVFEVVHVEDQNEKRHYLARLDNSSEG